VPPPRDGRASGVPTTWISVKATPTRSNTTTAELL